MTKPRNKNKFISQSMIEHNDVSNLLSIDAMSNILKIKPDGVRELDTFIKLAQRLFPKFKYIYANYLKKYTTFQGFANWLWKHGKQLQIPIVLVKLTIQKKASAIRWRSLIKLSDFARKNGTKQFVLSDESSVKTPEPQVFPAKDRKYIRSPHVYYTFPDIYVSIIKDGTVYGGSNLLSVDNNVICHDLYRFNTDYTSEELHWRTLIDQRNERIRWLRHDENPVKISIAASFVDAIAPNYAHWLTEVLPRVAVFCDDDRFKEIPIVVNDGLHRNIMESLFWITEPERKIILLPAGKSIYCDKIYVTSATGYVPFDWRTKKYPGCSHGIFSPYAFNVLYGRLSAQVTHANKKKLPNKLFLRRNSKYRTVVNSNEVEKLFISKGYTIIEPEKLSFAEQFGLFNNAKAIAGSSGAGLANIIFAPKGCDITIFVSKHPDTIYWYWQNIACATGNKIKYVLGKIREHKLKGVHASFSIDMNDLEVSLYDAG